MIVFKEYVDDLRIKLNKVADIVEEKDIQYGHHFVFYKGNDKVVVSAYYNKKNEFKLVWPQNKNQLCLELMAELGVKAHKDVPVNSVSLSEFDEICHFTGTWVGSDESGKGDFFGPLVVAAVALNNEKAQELYFAGVKDCKLLTDDRVLQLEQIIKSNVLQYCVWELLPVVYNKCYVQEKNLNILNAKGHFTAISNVLAKIPQAKGVLIDQFLQDDSLVNKLSKAFPDKKFCQRPRAENDMAVAAASVLARAKFLRSMKDLAQQAGVAELPKGSGEVQAAVAKEIAQKFGKQALNKFVKTHFVTYKEI